MAKKASKKEITPSKATRVKKVTSVKATRVKKVTSVKAAAKKSTARVAVKVVPTPAEAALLTNDEILYAGKDHELDALLANAQRENGLDEVYHNSTRGDS